MFEFYDPCESCSQPLDSPACKECKITILAAIVLMRCIPLLAVAMRIARFDSNLQPNGC